MNKKLYIHIGGHKTGSTAIQTHLKLNTKILNENKILYLDGFKSELIKKAMNENLTKKTKFFKNYFQSKELNESVYEKYIISRATFSGNPDSHYKDSLTFAQALFDSTKDDYDVKIIFYFREILSFTDSLYNQHLKSKLNQIKNIKYIEFINKYNLLNSYKVIIDNYSNYFGFENLILRDYSKLFYQGKNEIVKDFFKILNIKDNIILTKKNINPRIDNNIIELFQYTKSNYFTEVELKEIKEGLMQVNFNPMLKKYLFKNNKDCSFIKNQSDLNQILKKIEINNHYLKKKYSLNFNTNSSIIFYNFNKKKLFFILLISLIQKSYHGYLKNYITYKKIIHLQKINFNNFQKIILIIFLNLARILSKLKNILKILIHK